MTEVDNELLNTIKGEEAMSLRTATNTPPP